MSDRVVEAEGLAEVGVEDTVPIVGVLFAQRSVEAVGVAKCGDIGAGCALAQHLDDWIARDEMD
jgi:hypothetical protein